MSNASRKFKQSLLRSAIVGALMAVPVAAMAANTPGNLPANGTVVTGGDITSVSTISSGTTNETLIVKAPSIVKWGPSGTTNGTGTLNPQSSYGGFNIGQGYTVTVKGSASNASLLNIDVSGTQSTIAGKLISEAGTGGTDTAPTIFIANANGITVTSSAVINAPAGLGLIGGNVNTNNFSNSELGVSFSGNSPVTIASGAQITKGADFFFVAGSGNVNVGSVMKTGSSSSSNVSDILLVGNTAGVLNFSTPSSAYFATNDSSTGGQDSSTATTLTVGANVNDPTIYANGNLVNTASITLGANPIEWTGTFTNSGTLNLGKNTILGGITKSGTSHTIEPTGTNGSGSVITGEGIYNNNPNAQPFGGFTNNGTVIMSQPDHVYINVSSFNNSGKISVPGLSVTAFNGNITNTGSINIGGNDYVKFYAGGANPTGNITLNGTIAAVGSYQISYLTATAGRAGSITVGTPITTTGAAHLFYNKLPTNYYAGISLEAPNGNVTVNSALVSKDKNVAVNIMSGGPNSTVTVSNSGSISSAGNVNFLVPNAQATQDAVKYSLNGNVSVGANSSVLFGKYWVFEPVYSGGVITSYDVTYGDAHTAGVTGTGTVTAGTVDFGDVIGNINNRTSKSDYLKNGFNLAQPSGDSNPMYITFTADGPTAQAINLNIKGDASISSGDTINGRAAGIAAGTGISLGSYVPAANAGSSLLVQASGNLTITSGSGGGDVSRAPNVFNFPGGVAFVAGKSLNVNAVVDNAWSGTGATPFQGQYYDAPTINVNAAAFYTSHNNWVNFSVMPTTLSGTLPQVYNAQLNPNNVGGYALVPVMSNNIYQNSYTTLITTAASGGNWVAKVNKKPLQQ